MTLLLDGSFILQAKMKSSTCHALLLSLVLAAVPVQGGRVNPQAYRLREAPNYISAARASENDNPTMLKRSDYLDTAIELVKRIAPDSTFRIVDDHYVGTNGVGHVYFRQTVDDRDVENADFSVNVRVMTSKHLTMLIASRLLATEAYSPTATRSSRET